jgi:protein arginine kinase activator
MLCCICKEKQATVHLTQIVNDKVQKVDLCENCAKEKGIDESAGFMMADVVLGLGAAQEIEQATGGVELRCPRCSFTQEDFKKSGRLGCPECYETFAEGLDGLLKSMHKGTRHIGKIPRAQRATVDVTERLKQLNKRLELAVNQEDYEQAALLRDEIKSLKAHGAGKESA